MGGTTIRRLANRKGVDGSVQRFVITAADVSGALILAAQPSEVELVFAWIEHVNCMPVCIILTNSSLIDFVLSILATQVRETTR